MSLALGVDTGGTYTDAVLIRDEQTVVAKAKALTTRHDLAEGIGNAVATVLDQADVFPDEIALASLSTTLATNALVEGQGGRVALVLIGFRDADLGRHGLTDALSGDPLLLLAGGHDHAGNAVHALETDRLLTWLEEHGTEVSAFAVAGQFATRNPLHEQEAARIIHEATGRPVSCSHHLSSKLHGPKRAVTAVLNARLLGMIDQLISRAETRLGDLGITAPLMVVRGDGALISAEMAREKPIETILSGPAASIVGAHWLTRAQDALVSDIGGTTTDIALLRNGRPSIDPDGARVGPYRTMVEAVAMRTTGLGGDSEVHVNAEGLAGGVTLGPQRVLPVSLLAVDAPDVVHETLDKQLASPVPSEFDGRFVRALGAPTSEGLEGREAELLARIAGHVHPLGQVLQTRLERRALRRLVGRGLVQIAGVTPSDASHVLGKVNAWDKDAAAKALDLFRRRRTGAGTVLADSAEDMARMIVDQLTDQTKTAMLETVFAEEATDFGAPPAELARDKLLRAALAGHQGLLQIDARLSLPVIGLGASAASYYPAVGKVLNADMRLPEHAEVANAIGAVVGRVTVRKSATVTAPSAGTFRVHLADGPQDFSKSEQALDEIEAWLKTAAQQDAREAGAQGVRVTTTRDIKTANVEGQTVFIEATVVVEASGRPRIADD
jgi:N-methylhydantoinase A/oxoprolinase/acetone carboxylase beta subunit